MEKQDLIIGCSTNYDWSKLKYWINSINKSGFQGKKVMILMNCEKETVEKITESGFEVISFGNDGRGNLIHQSPMMVHVERFAHIYNYLSQNNFRYVITTDVKDVIFQRDPFPELDIRLKLADKDLIVSSESMKYKNEPWGNQNLMETYGPFFHDKFKDNEIYNVGVLAGKSNAIRDLALNIFLSSMNRPIPICDQSTFNVMISLHPYNTRTLYAKSEDGWACQLGTTVDPSKIEEFKPYLLEESPKMISGEVVTNKSEQPFLIVHQYDRVPEWRKIIEAKYE